MTSREDDPCAASSRWSFPVLLPWVDNVIFPVAVDDRVGLAVVGSGLRDVMYCGGRDLFPTGLRRDRQVFVAERKAQRNARENENGVPRLNRLPCAQIRRPKGITALPAVSSPARRGRIFPQLLAELLTVRTATVLTLVGSHRAGPKTSSSSQKINE